MKKKFRERMILFLHKLIVRLRYGNLRKEYSSKHALMGWGDWACDLMRAFGEDPSKTCGFTLEVSPDAAVTVTVKRYANLEETSVATEIVRKFAWKELKE